MSIHPTQSNEDVYYMTNAIKQLAENHQAWSKDYHIDLAKGVIQANNTAPSEAIKTRVNASFAKRFVAQEEVVLNNPSY